MADERYHVWNKVQRRHEALNAPLHKAATITKLDPHEVSAMIEEHGRVDTDTHRIRPANRPFEFAFLKGK